MTNEEAEQLKAWAADTLHGVDEARIFIAHVPRDVQRLCRTPEVVLQLGAALLLGKPLVLLVQRGASLPAGLQRAAEGCAYYEAGDMRSLKRATLAAMRLIDGVEVEQ